MKEYIAPNFEDDDVQPSKVDLKWFTRMMIYAIVILGTISASIYIAIYFIVGGMSLEDEKRFFGDTFIDSSYTPLELDFLSREVISKHDIYLSPSSEINAYATLGGNIIFTKGILESFNSEEEFVFVLGHEAGHIENRDIMNYYTQQMPFYLTMKLIGLNFNTTLVSNIFSQNQEMRADRAGLAMIEKYEYNSDCVIGFFEEENIFFTYFGNLASTHPSNRARKRQIENYGVNTDKECIELDYLK